MTSSDVRPNGKSGYALPAFSLGIYIVLSEGISLQNLDDSTINYCMCVAKKKRRGNNQDAMNNNISVTWRSRVFWSHPKQRLRLLQRKMSVCYQQLGFWDILRLPGDRLPPTWLAEDVHFLLNKGIFQLATLVFGELITVKSLQGLSRYNCGWAFLICCLM